MISIVAKNIVKEGCVEKFIEIAKELIIESNKEEGCIEYQLYQDLNNKNVLTFIEKWKDENAIEIHKNTKHFTTAVSKLTELTTGPMDVNLYKEI